MAEAARALPCVLNEAELVTELQAGSDAAFDWLVTHYHGPVFNVAYGILADSTDSADVTQEVFIKAFRGIRTFRGSSSLKTWLYRIAVREALNHKRWWWRHCRQESSLEADFGDLPRTLEIRDVGPSPFDQLAAQEIQAVIHRALAEVPQAFRSALILRDLEGLSYEEVAEVLDVSVGTVKSRILRGRRILREVLEPILGARSAERSAATSPLAAPEEGVA